MTDLIISKETLQAGDAVIGVEMSRLDHSSESMSHLTFSYGKEKSFDAFVKVAPDRYELDALIEQVKAGIYSMGIRSIGESHESPEQQCVNWTKYQVGTLATQQLSTGVVKADHYYVTIDATLTNIPNTLDSRSGYKIKLYRNDVNSIITPTELTRHLNSHPSTPIYQITETELISRKDCAAGECNILNTRSIWLGTDFDSSDFIDLINSRAKNKGNDI
ncbi:hypothetical protein [uncultured Psychrobacter sp.]|uniref:hypothetical protein n=1 Tax=uncultured Psychrobacter sp. TaxID=259303 RepID=UPI0030DA06C1